MKIEAFTGLQKVFPESDKELNALRTDLYLTKASKLVALTQHPAFPERSEYLSNGIYRFEETAAYSAGADRDFNSVIEKLSTTFMKCSRAQLLENPRAGSFAELAYFKFDGDHLTFGPEVCKKLLEDFKAHVNEAAKLGGYFYDVYANLLSLFTTAVDGAGCVTFTAYV